MAFRMPCRFPVYHHGKLIYWQIEYLLVGYEGPIEEKVSECPSGDIPSHLNRLPVYEMTAQACELTCDSLGAINSRGA